MKVLVGIAVVAVLAALATNWLRHRGETYLHHQFDTALPSQVEAHPWAPVRHGRSVPANRVTFQDGELTATRCHVALGGYSVLINHRFAFQRASVPIKAGCPGRTLQSALAHATHVEIESRGKVERLVFTDDHDRTVAQLQGRSS